MTRFSFHFSVAISCIVAVLSVPVQAEPIKSGAPGAKTTVQKMDAAKPASGEKTVKEPPKTASPASPAPAADKKPTKSNKKSPEDSKTDAKPAKKASVDVPKAQTTTATALKTDNQPPAKVSKQSAAKLKIEAVKGKPGVVTKVVTESASSASTVSTATGSAAAVAKTTTGKAASPGVKSELHKIHRPAMSLVPPPPPETPTVLAVPGMLQTFGIPFDQTPTNFPQHHKELVAQLNSAKKILDDKTQHATDVQARAEQFKSLFGEGVISKRELENAQSEADSSNNDLNDAKLKVASLQSALTRLEERMSASNKTGAGKGAKGHQANNKKVAQKKAVQADAGKAANRLPRPAADQGQTLIVTDKAAPHNAVASKATSSAGIGSSAGVGSVAASTTTTKSATADSASANAATSTTTAISSSKPVAPITSNETKKPPTLPAKSSGDSVKDSIE